MPTSPRPAESSSRFELSLTVAVVLLATTAIIAVVRVILVALRGGQVGSALVFALLVVGGAAMVATFLLWLGKRAERRQRPQWMAQTREYLSDLVRRQEEARARERSRESNDERETPKR